MKILIASDLHWPVLNGVATFSRNLAQGMAARGHEVIVIAPSQDGKKSIEVDGDYTIYRVRSTIFPFYQNFRISPTPQLEVRKIIQEFQPDIIHIQMLMWIGQAAMYFGRRYSIPIVTTSHAMADNLLDNLRKMSYDEAMESLLSRKGIGKKVANCICLFGLHHVDAFPIDTHVKQLLDKYYSDGFDFERYKGVAGIIQQYLFYFEL